MARRGWNGRIRAKRHGERPRVRNAPRSYLPVWRNWYASFGGAIDPAALDSITVGAVYPDPMTSIVERLLRVQEIVRRTEDTRGYRWRWKLLDELARLERLVYACPPDAWAKWGPVIRPGIPA